MADNQVTREPCPNPWCNSHKSTDCEIRAAEAPILMPSKASPEWAVACPVCPMQTPWFDTEAEALAAWNNRTPPAPSGGDVERVAEWFKVYAHHIPGCAHFMLENGPHGLRHMDCDCGFDATRAALAAMDSEPGVVWLLVEAAAALNVATDGQEALRPQRTAVLDALRAFEQAQPAPRPVEAGEVTQVSADVAELVIAARELVFSDHRPVGSPETQAEVELIEMFDSLDKATEAFSERIPWHDEPETETRHRQQSLSAARAEIEGLRKVLKQAATFIGNQKHTKRGEALSKKLSAALSTDQGEG